MGRSFICEFSIYGDVTVCECRVRWNPAMGLPIAAGVGMRVGFGGWGLMDVDEYGESRSGTSKDQCTSPEMGKSLQAQRQIPAILLSRQPAGRHDPNKHHRQQASRAPPARAVPWDMYGVSRPLLLQSCYRCPLLPGPFMDQLLLFYERYWLSLFPCRDS
jgi:hypothetical protein